MNTVLMVCLRRYYKKKIQLLSIKKKGNDAAASKISKNEIEKLKQFKKVSKFFESIIYNPFK
jgi:hypothetical protein